MTNAEALGRGIASLVDGLQNVLRPMDRTLGQVAPPAGHGRRDDLGIERREVRRRHGVQRLSRHEPHPICIFRPQPAQVIGCAVPPILEGQKSLLPDLERRGLPARMLEAMVKGPGLEGRRGIVVAFGEMARQLGSILPGAFEKLELAARRFTHVESPVHPGIDERVGRYARAQPRHRRADAAVKAHVRMLRSRADGRWR
jgi:hypothetical protein